MQKEIKSIVALFKQLVDFAPFVNIPMGHVNNLDTMNYSIQTYRAEGDVFAVSFGNRETGRIGLMCYDTKEFDTRTIIQDLYIHTTPAQLRAIERVVQRDMMSFLSSFTKRGEE
jgi:hypothetical protein